MPYGYIPYEKTHYKVNRHSFKKRRIIISAIIILAAAIIAAGIFFAIRVHNDDILSSTDDGTADSSQLLSVVGAQSPLDKSFVPKLCDYEGFRVNVLAEDSLSQMISDAASKGIILKIRSAYISYEEQNILYEETLAQYLNDSNLSKVRAEAEAQKQTPIAGCSEAQTGLLIDFDLSETSAKAFVQRECVNYGFVLRYPNGKEGITHKTSSDTLYRYVGVDNAKKMRAYDMCLEEYNDYLLKQGSQN